MLYNSDKHKEQYRLAAIKYAAERWCWDDESFIRELCDDELRLIEIDPPGVLMDKVAESCDLQDPFAPYGIWYGKPKPVHPRVRP